MGIDRRDFLGVAVGGALAGCSSSERPAPAPEPIAPVLPPADPKRVRIVSVPTAVEGKLLPELAEQFERHGGYRVELVPNPLAYQLAREGHADLVVSHYGHRDAEAFVLDGLGEWPRTIFSNQMALVGPPSDPAQIRGLADVVEAFRRIAATRSPFVLNDIDGVHYLTELLWHAVGKPERTGWVIAPGGTKDVAIRRASEIGGYALWGLTPFLRLDEAAPLALEPLVLDDPLLHRLMVSIVVKPGGVRATNVAGATALQTFLLEPSIQAQIRTVHYPGKVAARWVPAGRHNRSSMLPKG